MPPKQASESTAAKKKRQSGQLSQKAKGIFNARLDEFIEHSNVKTTCEFYPQVFHDHWCALSWRLPLTENPSDDSAPDATPDENLTVKERAEKAKVLTEIEKKIKAWFGYRKGHKTGRNLFDMRYKQKIQAELDTYPPESRNNVNTHGEVALHLFKQEPEDVQESVRKAVEAEYKEVMVEYNTSSGKVKGEGLELDEAEKALARELLAMMVVPLLQALQAHTGYHVTMLVGRIEGSTFDMRA
ncbi:hypothetical protein C8J57DRAFT_1536865 [Mycena rebaudengoi]|nr:hypothetical protein C8J57DRAFT_1536865 [Mycena rebaudengoi]